MKNFFKNDLKLDPDMLARFDSFTTFIWLFKPLYGFICDTFPIFGSHRKSYLIIFSILEIIAWFLIATVVSTFWGAVAGQMAINLSNGFVNVIGEAMIVEKT